MNKKELNVLASPCFLLGLCLLLLNDFLFKQLFQNWTTGKLSDFAGLFIFPLFWAALFPRFNRVIYLLTTTMFVFWKSSYSQPLIDFCNQWLLLPVSRTVDLTDLLALLVLPFSFAYFSIEHKASSSRLVPYFVGCVSLFAFTATSYANIVRYSGKEYAFTESKSELVTKTVRVDEDDDAFNFRANYPHKPLENPTNEFYIDIKPDFCDRGAWVTVEIENKSAGSIMTLKEIGYDDSCPRPQDEKDRLLATFERDFISKLRTSEPSPNDEAKPARK